MIGWIEKLLEGPKPAPRTVDASLFSRDEKFGLESLPFDLLVRETHELMFTIADHAVENGSVISDHVTPMLRSVTVAGMFSNHSVHKNVKLYSVDKKNKIQGVDQVEIDESDSYVVKNNAYESLKKLKDIANERKPVRLVTALEKDGDYDEMVIESLKYERGSDDGESVQFQMTLRQIKVVSLTSNMKRGEWKSPSPQETPEERALAEKKNDGKVSATDKKVEKYTQNLKAIKGGTLAGGN